ncbi:unnamed protein product [Leptidea sinapis]|uniref:Transmembrane 9 superfamily member n=1 Tax=Leptidea sinapis TaxID=189913 RepID=A0A5E4Q3W1_9NEOP|nr:unnamed protein product [Leptidea sinapis]
MLTYRVYMQIFIYVSWLIIFNNAFYVPGVAPVEFKKGQKIEVKAVKMTSIHTQLPYSYYSLPLCLPINGSFVYKSENLGEVLRGDRIVNTPYKVHMAENIKCRLLCHKANDPLNWSVEESEKVASRIEHEYFVHLLVDNLPVATKVINRETSEQTLEQGYKLGFMSKGKAYINNHLKFLLKYHRHSHDSYRVVGFEVETYSINKDEYTFIDDSCIFGSAPKPQLVNEDTGTKLYFTYAVEWGESDIQWASRWDIYLGMKDVQIHWFSIINSLVVLFFLSGILTMIMVRTLRRDIAKYNSFENIEDMIEETGWKLVHGDVFRPPPKRMLFAAVIGIIAMLGMLSPASRGELMTVAIFLYVFMGLIAGYYSARLYNTMKGKQWKQAAFLTATLFPAIVFGTCFFLNFFIMGKHSSGAVPFSTMMALLCLWFCISLPLDITLELENSRSNTLFALILYQESVLMAGILPFGAVFIELFFIFNALWENQFYYLFGFLFLVFCILVVSVSQISICMIYLQLCGEDYHWWWKSFIVSGGSAVYILVYSIFYFFTMLDITEFIPTLLYIGYTELVLVCVMNESRPIIMIIEYILKINYM